MGLGRWHVSNESSDCEPYKAGKSEIKRHFTADRVFNLSGDFRVEFRLKKKDKTIAVGTTMVKIRPGAGEIDGLGLQPGLELPPCDVARARFRRHTLQIVVHLQHSVEQQTPHRSQRH